MTVCGEPGEPGELVLWLSGGAADADVDVTGRAADLHGLARRLAISPSPLPDHYIGVTKRRVTLGWESVTARFCRHRSCRVFSILIRQHLKRGDFVSRRRRAASRQTAAVPLLLPPSEPCSFCEYLAGTRPYTVLHRDELTATLVTYEQRGRGHVLVIPVEHRVTVLELSLAEQSALMRGVVRATQAITGAFDPEGIAVWQNNGLPAHQSVPHVHFHVAGTRPEGGTNWGAVEKLDIGRTDQIADHLRPHLKEAVHRPLAAVDCPIVDATSPEEYRRR